MVFDGDYSTKREIVVLIAEGYTDEEISKKLHFSPATIKRHERELRKKFSARNRQHLVAKALILGFVTPNQINNK